MAAIGKERELYLGRRRSAKTSAGTVQTTLDKFSVPAEEQAEGQYRHAAALPLQARPKYATVINLKTAKGARSALMCR